MKTNTMFPFYNVGQYMASDGSGKTLIKLISLSIEDVGRARLHAQSSCNTTPCNTARKTWPSSFRTCRYYRCARCYARAASAKQLYEVSRAMGPGCQKRTL